MRLVLRRWSPPGRGSPARIVGADNGGRQDFGRRRIALAMTLKEHLCGADNVHRRVPLQERRDAVRRPSRPMPQPPMDSAIDISAMISLMATS
jgi:hypothetical protein